jgi:tetratricopeptide (TPR) repeat protein
MRRRAWYVSGAAGLALALALSRAGAADDKTVAPAADGESRFNAGLEHLRAGRIDLAIEEFKSAIKQDPKNPYFYKGLGVAYAQRADRCPDDACRKEPLREAVSAARKALELNPYYVDARHDLGIALLRSGDREQGKKELLNAFNDPTNPSPEQTARNLGLAYFEEKNYPQALSWYQTSVAKSRRYVDGYLGVANTLVAMGKLDEAIQQLEAGATALPEEWPVILALGEAYYRAGRFGEARARLELVAGKDPVGPSGRRAAELLKNFPK